LPRKRKNGQHSIDAEHEKLYGRFSLNIDHRSSIVDHYHGGRVLRFLLRPSKVVDKAARINCILADFTARGQGVNPLCNANHYGLV
jgi:hypothetical protein